MERAAKAVRRSGVKLLSLGGGHADLNVVISEQKDVTNTAKAFMAAQNSACQYLMKWAANEDNRAIQDVSSQVTELNLVWTEAQREFTEQLKDFKQMFELVLEGEKHVDQARNNLAACEHREVRIKKELKKAAKRATTEEIRAFENRLIQVERQTALALLEVEDKVRENDAIKLVRFKDGLLKLSTAYAELGRKCAIVFEAQRDISLMLPDVHEKDLEDIKYTGSGQTKHFVMQAKERVRQHRRRSRLGQSSLPISTDLEPPPPYSPGNFYDQTNTLPTLDDLNNPIVDLPQLPRRDFDDDCDKDTHSITSRGFLDHIEHQPIINRRTDIQPDYGGDYGDEQSEFHSNQNTNYLLANISNMNSAYQNTSNMTSDVPTTSTSVTNSSNRTSSTRLRALANNSTHNATRQPLRSHMTSVRQPSSRLPSSRQPSLEVAEDLDWGSEDELTTDDLSGAMGGLQL